MFDKLNTLLNITEVVIFVISSSSSSSSSSAFPSYISELGSPFWVRFLRMGPFFVFCFCFVFFLF